MAESSRSGGIGLTTVLGVVFVTLKLVDKIDWSWWWVLAPFWVPYALIASFLFIVGVIVALGKLAAR